MPDAFTPREIALLDLGRKYRGRWLITYSYRSDAGDAGGGEWSAERIGLLAPSQIDHGLRHHLKRDSYVELEAALRDQDTLEVHHGYRQPEPVADWNPRCL